MSKKSSTIMSGISNFLEKEEEDRLVELALSDIDPDPDQDRYSWDVVETVEHLESMTASIAESGVRRPIEVYEHSPGRYKIIAGEVRYRASLAAGKTTIPALLRLKLNDRQRSLDMLTENFSRLSLTPMELARALKMRLDSGLSKKDLMAATGKDKTWMSRMLGLLEMPDDVQTFAETAVVRDPARLHALAKIKASSRPKLYEQITLGEITVGEALASTKRDGQEGKSQTKSKPFRPDLTATKEEARILIGYFHPDWDCASDKDLDVAFKRLMGELASGEHNRDG